MAENQASTTKEGRQAFTKELILEWAKIYQSKNNEWPSAKSEMIDGVNESWKNIDECLKRGLRGLEGGSSLSQLLIERDLEGYQSTYVPPSPDEVQVQETIEGEEGETPIDGKFINNWALAQGVFSFGFLCIGSFLFGATATTSVLRGLGGAILFGGLFWLVGTMLIQEGTPRENVELKDK